MGEFQNPLDRNTVSGIIGWVHGYKILESNKEEVADNINTCFKNVANMALTSSDNLRTEWKQKGELE